MAPKDSAVAVRLENFISLPIELILRQLLETLESEKEQMRLIDFARRLEALYRVRLAERTQPLRRSFDLFMANAHTHALTAAVAETTEEDCFLERLHETLVKGNFMLLDDKSYRDAMAAEYVLNLDLELKRELLDSAPIRRLHANHAGEPAFAHAAPVTKDVLVYHRGIGQDSTTDLFIAEKIDLLMGLVLHGVLAVLSFLLAALQVWRYPAYVSRWRAASRDAGADGDGHGDGGDDPAAARPGERLVERQSLKNVLRQNWLYLFCPVTLKEPTFRELVLVYRTQEQLKNKKPGQPAQITVKSFKDVPKSDFEVILPAQTFVTRASDLLRLAGAAVAAIATVVAAVGEAKDAAAPEQEPSLAHIVETHLPIFVGLGSYAARIVMQFKMQQARYQNVSTAYLYDKAMDAGHGVRAYIQETTALQETKETLLAFFFLWQNLAINALELDDECEHFLAKLGDHADFEVDDALRKLLADGLVSIEGKTLAPTTELKALTMSRAIARLDVLWKEHFAATNVECPYCQYLQDHADPGSDAAA